MSKTGVGCHNHPKRLPIGRCPLCTRLVCDECHTRLDGILHCRDCLAERARELTVRGPRVGPRVLAAVLAVCVLLPALLGVRAFLFATGTVGGRISRRFAIEFAPGGGAPK